MEKRSDKYSGKSNSRTAESANNRTEFAQEYSIDTSKKSNMSQTSSSKNSSKQSSKTK